MKRLTREWVRKAEADYLVATRMGRTALPVHDPVCFHCQQTAEKYFKALLEELALTVPKTHDLDYLRALLLPYDSLLRPLRRGLVFLTGFAVDTRYPWDSTTRRQAQSALRSAGRIRMTARTILGLHRPRRKKSP